MADAGGAERAGAVSVDVYPDGKNFGRRLRQVVLPEAQRVGQELAKSIGAPISDQIASRISAGVADGARQSRPRAAAIGAQLGDAIARPIASRVARAVGDGLAAGGRGAARQGEQAGRAWAEGFARGAGKKTETTPVGPTRERSRRAGEESGGSFGDAFRRRVEAATRALPPVTIGVARNEAEAKIRDLRRELEQLSSQKIGIDLDAGEAMRRLNEVHAKLEQLGTESSDIQVRADTSKARAELASIQVATARLARSDPTIKVDVDGGGAVASLAGIGAAAQLSRGGISSLVVAGALIGPAIVPVAAAAVAALAAIGPAALAGAAGIGVMILGLSGVIGAVQAMSAAEDRSAQSAASMAGQQAAVAAAADQVRSAEVSLANARQTAADGGRRALQAVADAQRDLTRAEREALDVRRELTEAQEDARRQIEDLNASVEENALSQRQANLDVARAKTEMDRVLADPRATDAMREQARISYEREVLQIEDLQRRGSRLREDTAQANRAGVEGSEQVRAARSRIVRADEQVLEARRRIAEAQRAQDLQARQSAQQIEQAQRSLAAAHRAAGAAAIGAAVGGSAAMTKLNEAMAALSPEGRRFARFLFSLRDEFGALKRAAEAGLLPGIEAGLRALLPYFPNLITFVGRVAGALGEMFEAGLKALTSPFWREFFGEIGDVAVPALRDMFAIAGNVTKAIAGMILAFLPLGTEVGGGLREMTARWAEWAAGLRDNPGFQKFLDYVREVGPVVVEGIGAIVRAISRIVQAAAPIGGVVLLAIVGIANAIASIPVDVLTTMIGVIIGVIVAVKAWIVVQTLLNIAMALNPAGIVIIAILALIAVIVIAWRHSETFRNIVMAAWAGIQVAAVYAWEKVLKPIFDAWVVYAKFVAGVLLWFWHNIVVPAWQGISAIISWAWDNIISPIFSGIRFWVSEVLAPLFLFWWHQVIEPAFQGIQLAISIAWAVIQVIFKAIQIFIRVVLAPIFIWLWRSIVKPAFEGLVAVIRIAWAKIQPIFEMLGGFIKTKVVPVFQAGVTAIGKIWEKIRDIAKIPVKFVVETVLNNGLIAGFNWIATKVGVTPIKPIPLPKGFARGTARLDREALGLASGGTIGVLPGYTPGRDVHRFYSASGGALDLSGGEAVMRPEFASALGASNIDAANRAARSRGVAGVRDWLHEMLGAGNQREAYAAGGIRPGYLGAFDWGGIIGKVKSAWNAFTDPVGTLKSVAGKAIAAIPGAGIVKDIAVNTGKRILDGAVGWLMSKVGIGGGDPGNWPASPGSQRGDSGVWRSVLALIRSTGPLSGTFGNAYRPGDPKWHGSGRAVDWMGFNQDALASVLAGKRPLELIHRTNRRDYAYTRGQNRGSFDNALMQAHRNHIHIALPGGGIIPYGVYDGGGYLPQGLSLAANYTSGSERMAVFTQRQEQDLHALAASARPGTGTSLGGRATLTIENYHEASADPDAVAADLDWRMRGGGG